jgi:hypothetical protein
VFDLLLALIVCGFIVIALAGLAFVAIAARRGSGETLQ